MQHYKKLLLGMVATLSLFATATPVFASTGGTLAKHRDFNTSISSTATVQKSTTQATQATSQRELTASESNFGFNVLDNNPNTIKYKDTSGNFVTGWFKDGNRWMYADANGYIQLSKWIQDGGSYYYVGYDGNMLTGCNVDGYHLNAKTGVWDGNADANAPTYKLASILSGSGGTDSIPLSDFNAGIANGTIKAKVTYYTAMGNKDLANNEGMVEFYYAK